jgi:hypothetical protein
LRSFINIYFYYKMENSSFDKNKFCIDFSNYYYNSDILNVANAFMDYFNTRIFNTPIYDLWYQHFFQDHYKDNRRLYCKLLKILQKNVKEKYMLNY